MSLKISNHATDKQKELLHKLEYYGDMNLTVEAAAAIIDELFEEQRIHRNDDLLIGFDATEIDIY